MLVARKKRKTLMHKILIQIGIAIEIEDVFLFSFCNGVAQETVYS